MPGIAASPEWRASLIFLPPGPADARRPSSLALPLLAGSSARRNPVQALDRDCDPGDRARSSSPSSLSRAIPGFLSPAGLADTGRQAGEIGFVVLGIALVVIVGGIDLSVGSMFALCDFCALFCLDVLDWPVPAVIAATLVCGAMLGAVNGILIGYLRLRAFITTLITLIIYRSAYDLLLFDYSNEIAAAFPDIPSWNFVGGGVVVGRAERGAGLSRRRHLRARLPDPAAAGLAHHRDRRLAPLGVQFRHSGAAHDRALLRRQRRPDLRSARCSLPRGSAPSAATSASASRSPC